jgi:hypothetical protein
MEFRISITVNGHGSAEKGERVLEAFLDTHSEAGPVVGCNLEADTLTVTYSLDAPRPMDAVEAASAVFAQGWAETGLDLSSGLSAEVELVEAGAELARELQPA